MHKNLKIYYINLDRSQDRRKFMEQQFDNLGIKAIRVKAIDGKELPKSDILEIENRLKQSNEHYTLPNVGEIGVYLSHKKIWEIVSKQKEDFALILEDDALIDMKLISDLNTLLSFIRNGEIIDISGLKGFLPLESKINKDIEIIRYLTPSLVIISTIFTRNAAKRMLEVFKEYNMPVDNMLQQVYKHKSNIWITKHPYVKTNYKNLGGSTIQNQSKKSLIEKLKREILRPIYRVKTHIKNVIAYIK